MNRATPGYRRPQSRAAQPLCYVSGMLLTDPTYTPRAHDRLWERAALRFILDPRDLPFVRVIFSVWLVLGTSCGILLFGPFRWWHAALHLLAIYAVFFPSAVLMLHNTSHRALFKPVHKWMNLLIPWTVTPLLGVTPETYFAHHVGMHHVEDNLPNDLSSTMRYQRDSALDFARYYLSFMTVGLYQLARYFYRKRRFKMMRSLLAGEAAWFAAATAATLYNPKGALFALWLPLVATRFFMMGGNWAQHAFIDRARPDDNYVSAATCVNSVFNHRAFNDGYHIGHHLKATMHWTEMPVEFAQNTARYTEEGSIIFRGLDWGVIWFLLMIKAYRTLAKRVVVLEGTRSTEEIIALLKARVAAIPRAQAARSASSPPSRAER